jgi:DNA-binding IclR family transcriptional regulator
MNTEDLTESAAAVLTSLREKPALNTPALIAMDQGVERDEAEAALAELRSAGLVNQSAMGWRLATS